MDVKKYSVKTLTSSAVTAAIVVVSARVSTKQPRGT